MIFPILTLLSALSLAAVSGWFSVIGIMSIYAAYPIHSLIMGVVLECGKLVTTSWLYRNWKFSNWKLKLPLIISTIVLMLTTSIGVFGFLSKAHLEQGASTINNGAKIERLDQQIAREKSIIQDNEKVIAQLDATVNSYIGKDRTDRSVAIRRSQAPQRKQLRIGIESAQKKIDELSDEKLKLQSEIRELQLEVGPIRYISELIYNAESDSSKNIEAAVRIFTLFIVSTLDPLAVMLLIAANHTLMRYREEKDVDKKIKNYFPIKEEPVIPDKSTEDKVNNVISTNTELPNEEKTTKISSNSEKDRENVNIQNNEGDNTLDEPKVDNGSTNVQIDEKQTESTKIQEVENTLPEFDKLKKSENLLPIIHQPLPTVVNKSGNENVDEFGKPWAHQESTLRELLGSHPHFSPVKLGEDVSKIKNDANDSQISNSINDSANLDKYPRPLSWLKEFRRS